MYSLPLEYWDEYPLTAINNGLGEFIKAVKETKLQRYTFYAWIYVYMKLGQALPELVSLLHDDFEWIQPLDYEHVPFRCRCCHSHGHRIRDCPLNMPPKAIENGRKSDLEGFTKLESKRRHTKKHRSVLKHFSII